MIIVVILVGKWAEKHTNTHTHARLLNAHTYVYASISRKYICMHKQSVKLYITKTNAAIYFHCNIMHMHSFIFTSYMHTDARNGRCGSHCAHSAADFGAAAAHCSADCKHTRGGPQPVRASRNGRVRLKLMDIFGGDE